MLDTVSRAALFPSLAEMVYLNTAAEGIPSTLVGEAFARFFKNSQAGAEGRTHHMAEWQALREGTAELYGLTAAEIAICPNTSSAFNLAAAALRLQPGDEVIVNDLDFPSGRTPWLLPDSPAEVRVWRAREGALRVEDLIPLLSPRTRLLATSLVSFWNGYTLPWPEVVAAVRQHSPALLALDVTQALGRIPLAIGDADFIVSSTHKWICGTHGAALVGVPEARRDTWTAPVGGWFNLQDPFERDAGDPTLPKPGADSLMVGMPAFGPVYAVRAALDYIREIGVERIDAAARPLVQQCAAELAELPVEPITPTEDASLAGILAFRHPEMERLHAGLRAENIHVMHNAGRIRIAIHGYNTHSDVEALIRTLHRLLVH